MEDVIRWVLAGLCSLAGITVCVVFIMCSRTYKHRRRMLDRMQQHPNITRDDTKCTRRPTVSRSEDSELNSQISPKRRKNERRPIRNLISNRKGVTRSNNGIENRRLSNRQPIADNGGQNLEYRRLSNRLPTADTGGNNLEYRRLSYRNRSSATDHAKEAEYCRFSYPKDVTVNLGITNDKNNALRNSVTAEDSKTGRRTSIFEELEIPMEQLHIPRVRLNRMPFGIDEVAIDLV